MALDAGSSESSQTQLPKKGGSPGFQLDSDRLRHCMEALLDLSLSAGTVFDPEEHARHALDRLVTLLGAERGLLLLASEDGTLVPVAVQGADGPYPYSSTIVKEACDKRSAVLTFNAVEDPRFARSQSVGVSGLRSVIAAPLMAQNRLVGAIYLDNRLQAGVFKADDLAVVSALANHIAHSLETARAAQLEARLQVELRQRELAEILRETALSLSSSLEHEQVLDRLLRGLARVVPYDSSLTFFVYEEAAADPALAAWLQEIQVTQQPRIRIAPDLPAGFSSWVGVPLVHEQKPVGVLVLQRSEGTFGDHEAQLAFAFASQAGIAFENARLFAQVRELATVDQLTGVWNRHHLLALADQEFRRVPRTGRPLSLIMVDVDHFKRFNDTYGHFVGDLVLREVAQRCRRALRDMDIFGRYGGEEFVAVLPETALPGAQVTAERLRNTMRDRTFATEKHGDLPITISLGVAQLQKDMPDLEALLQRADAALYAAKDAGRDCFRPAS